MTTPTGASRYAVPLGTLERSAHVPAEEQRTGLAEAPAEPVRSEWASETSWFLRYGAG
jgi:hypothetical protein